MLALAVSGCAVQTRQLRSEQPDDLPARQELTATPFFPDESYYCGPAVLATVLTAAGLPTQPEPLAEQIFLPAREGSLQLEMLAGARRGGAVATLIPGELDALMREIVAGHPVAILQNLGLAWAPSWHYAVVVGYDLPEGKLFLRSGPMKRQELAMRTFEHTWARAGHWAFVALPPGQLPATAKEDDAVRALVAFERTATPADAEKAYTAGIERWPENLVLKMGLGNARYANGDLPGAAQAFRSAAEQHDSAAAYNNLALILLELGETDKAREAALTALDLAGHDDETLLATLRRINAD